MLNKYFVANISGCQRACGQVLHSKGCASRNPSRIMRNHNCNSFKRTTGDTANRLIYLQALGGRVESKVPRQGYILVQLNTPEEERLRLCWTSADRPDRHFVPYTFVEACKVAGVLLKQIFVENGVPIPMHIHPSIANVNARNALSLRISVRLSCIYCVYKQSNVDSFAELGWRSSCFCSICPCHSC